MHSEGRSEPERLAAILSVLMCNVDRKIGRDGCMLMYLLEMAHMEAQDLAMKQREGTGTGFLPRE